MRSSVSPSRSRQPCSPTPPATASTDAFFGVKRSKPDAGKSSHRKTIERLTVLVVIIASIKFLFEGGNLHLFGHADSMTYGLFLSPVLGAHSFIHTRKDAENNADQN